MEHLRSKGKPVRDLRVAAKCCSEFATANCGASGGGAAASAVPASAMVYGRANLAKKDKGAALVLTEAWIGPEMACRVSASWTGGESRAALGEEMLQWRSGRLDPSQGFDVDL